MKENEARFYDPSIGRFLTPDPAGTIDSPNLYAYVLNDPINFTDPSGLKASIWQTVLRWLSGGGGGGGGSGSDPFIPAPGGGFIQVGPIEVVTPSRSPPFNGVAFDQPPSNGNGPQNAGRGGGGQCTSPPVTDRERQLAQQGDRRGFFQSRLERGDPLARTALDIVNDRGFLGMTANARLFDAISERNGGSTIAPNGMIIDTPIVRQQSVSSIFAEINQIGVELAQAHVDAVDFRRGNVSASDIARYHFAVFAQYGLPPTTFGGSPNTGTTLEAEILAGLYLGCP